MEPATSASAPGSALAPLSPRSGVPLARIALEFQPDAIEIEQRPLPRAARTTLYLLFGLIVCAVAWATVAHIDRIVVAHGKLITTAPTIVVQPLELGLIRTIDVQVGDVVRQGQRLGTLDQTFAAADVEQLQKKRDSFRAQIDRLEAELDSKPYPTASLKTADDRLQAENYAQRRRQFSARMEAFDRQISQAEAAAVTKRTDWQRFSNQLAVAKELEDIKTGLHQKEVGSRVSLLEARANRLQIERDMQLSFSQIAELQEEIKRARAERQSFIEEWRQKIIDELVNARREYDSAVKELEKAEKRNALVVLTAPTDAVVLDIAQRSIGSVLKEAEPFFTLVPLNVPLEAEVSIDAKDIGHVVSDASARIKLDAYPFQKHGTLEGSVRTVSEDAFTDKDDKEKAGQAFYRSRITLRSHELRAVPDSFRLIPGMTVTAEIKAGDRTVLSYFLYPLLRGLDESIREP